jgi:anti-sigma factor RsiW
MRCDRALELISPFVDGELREEDRQAVAAHIEACADCAALAVDIRRMSKAIAEVGREPAPKALFLRVRSTLASAARDRERGKKWFALWRVPSGIVRQAGMLAASCALSVLLTWSFMTSTGRANRLEQELLTAHIRSLLQDSPIQVASSDSHNVKPWFAGRVDFAPGYNLLAWSKTGVTYCAISDLDALELERLQRLSGS